MPTWRGLRTGSRTTQRPSTASWSPRRPGGRRQGGLEEPRIRTPHRAGPRRHRQRSNSHRHRAPPPHRPRRRPHHRHGLRPHHRNSASTTSSKPPTAPTPHSGKPGRAVYRQTADSGLTHVLKPGGSTGGGSGAGRAPVLRKRRVGGQPALLRRRWSKLPRVGSAEARLRRRVGPDPSNVYRACSLHAFEPADAATFSWAVRPRTRTHHRRRAGVGAGL